MGQGQPRVIIWTIFVVLPYTMLHTKFQGHWSIGSGEEDVLMFLPYMGMAAMLVMWPRPFEQFFFPKVPGSCIWNLVAIGPVVTEEKSFEIVDGRTTEPVYTISSLRLRWAKKKTVSEKRSDMTILWADRPREGSLFHYGRKNLRGSKIQQTGWLAIFVNLFRR